MVPSLPPTALPIVLPIRSLLLIKLSSDICPSLHDQAANVTRFDGNWAHSICAGARGPVAERQATTLCPILIGQVDRDRVPPASRATPGPARPCPSAACGG